MKRILAMLMVLLLVALGAAAEEAVELGGIDIDPATVEALDALEADDAIEAGDDLELVLEDEGLPGDLDLGLDLDLAGDGDGLALELPGGEPAFDLAASTEGAANAAVGDEIEKDGIRYEITEAGATVKEYAGDKASVTVPASVEGYPVTAIGDWAFSDCSSMTEITLPDGLITIGADAFYGCSSLKKLTIPATVTACGESAFYECASLAEFTAPSGCITGISRCELDKLKSITLLAGGQYTIPDQAFFSFASLKEITLPKGLTAVGDEAFWRCTSLTSITLPDGVTAIGRCAFYECPSLTTIKLPDSLISIGYNAFGGCSALERLSIPVSVTESGGSLFTDCTALTELTAPVCCLGFQHDSILQSITVLANGEYELNGTFSGLDQLTKLTLADGLTAIGSYTFCDCSSLKRLSVPATCTKIDGDHYTFSGCSLTELSAPVEFLTAYMADMQSRWPLERNALEAVTVVGKGGYRVPDAMFSECDVLKSVTLTEGLTAIGKGAFKACGKLAEIHFPDGRFTVAGDAFEETALSAINLPKGATFVGKMCFAYCGALTSFEIPEGKTAIDEDMFAFCTSLKRITIPNSVTSIGKGAFAFCESLVEITVPESVTTIGEGVFSWCSSLKHIDLPKRLRSESMRDVFDHCSSLTSVVVPKGVKNLMGTFKSCMALTSVTLPDGVEKLGPELEADGRSEKGSGAFERCVSLKKIDIPKSVRCMNYAFRGCDALEHVVIPKGVTSLSNTFAGCVSLKEISVPDSVTSIVRAFRGCSALKAVSIPDGVTSIDGSFEGCTALESVRLPGKLQSIRACSFKGCAALKQITLPDSLKEIGEQAFWNCKAFERIQIPGKVASVGNYAFMGCTHLKEAVLKPGVKALGELCFGQCVSLRRIEIPASVKTFGDRAFMRGNGYRDWKYESDYDVEEIPPKLTGTITILPKLTICGEAGSTAAKYAKQAKIPFRILPKSVAITQGKAAKLITGEKLALAAKLTPADAQATLTWTSSDPKVATVTKKGVVKAEGAGKATITVTTDNGLKAVCKVTVLQKVTVKLDKTKATVVVGAKLALKPTLSPAGVKTKLTWTSSAPKVATVTNKGVVKAVGAGTATITVTNTNGGKAVCKVTVPTPPKTVKFAKAGYTVKVGKSVKLVVKLNPTKARTTRTFTSSNRKVATVDKNGVVKGLKKGTATITVSTANGLKATVEVVVE